MKPPIHYGERWTPAEDSILGGFSDREAARMLKRPLGGIQSRRRKLRVLRRDPRGNRPWTPIEIKLLGAATDREVAEALARPLKAVRLKRQRLGIAAFRPVKED